MNKLDSKKIDSLLKQIENVGKGAVRALNEMTDNSFVGSDFEKDPLKYIGYIANTLQEAKEQAKIAAKYDGMDDDQIAQYQADERETERESLQQLVNERLAARQPKEESEPSEETGEPVDHSKRPDPA